MGKINIKIKKLLQFSSFSLSCRNPCSYELPNFLVNPLGFPDKSATSYLLRIAIEKNPIGEKTSKFEKKPLLSDIRKKFQK